MKFAVASFCRTIARTAWHGAAAEGPRMKIAYLLKTFPKLSETFVLNEILELERQGLEVHIFSLRQPSETKVHPGVAEVKAKITYLRHTPLPPPPERVPFEKLAHKVQMAEERRYMFLHHPMWFLRTWLFHPWCGRKRLFHTAFLTRWGARKRYFYQAIALARELQGKGFTHLHAHFANEPASVGELAHRLARCRFSFTAHAKDIYLTDREELARKIAAAEFVITCTQFNRDYLQEIARNGTPIHLCYHGVDLSRFSGEQGHSREGNGGRPLILSVGRFCEKKGFPYLIRGCHRLKQDGRRFVCRIVGFGPLQEQLEDLIRDLELKDYVLLAGKMTQDKLIQEYRRADLFVLPCLVADDGDRDGIPNVLVEAMAMRIPVVSTPVSGIVELVDHMKNGLLAREKDSEALAAAMALLLDDPGLREQFGANGRQKVMAGFRLDRSTAKVRHLLTRTEEKFAGAAPASPVFSEEASGS